MSLFTIPKRIKNTKLSKKLHKEYTVIDDEWIEVRVPFDMQKSIQESLEKGISDPVILVHPKQWDELLKQTGGLNDNTPRVRLTNYVDIDSILIVEDSGKWWNQHISERIKIARKERDES